MSKRFFSFLLNISLTFLLLGSLFSSQAGIITQGYISKDLDAPPTKVTTFSEDDTFIARPQHRFISKHAGVTVPHAVRSRSCCGC